MRHVILGDIYLLVKWLGHDADNLHSRITKIRNVWSSTFTSPHVYIELRFFKNRDNDKSTNSCSTLLAIFKSLGRRMSFSCVTVLKTDTALDILMLRYVVSRYHNLTS